MFEMENSLKRPGDTISLADAREIAREAYIFGYPMVANYRVQYTYFVNRQSPEFKAPWNHICNIPRVYTPDDRATVAPNSDTPYSFLGMDLRAEPVVLTVPHVDEGRYFSIQLVDLFTFNFDYISSRTTGNDGGHFLVAGPGWKGTIPDGIRKVFHSETDLAMAMYRTQLFGPDDLNNVKKIQEGYNVQTLSEFLGKPAPRDAPKINFIEPLTPEQQKTSAEFFSALNFVLNFCPVHPSEKGLMDRFAQIGVGAGRDFNAGALSPEMRGAIEQGIAGAWAEFADLKKNRFDTHEVVFGDVYGTREYLKNNYLYRMAGVVMGLFGASKEEAMYPLYAVDSDGGALDGANHYSLRFEPGNLPPVNAFWSLTMYGLPEFLLVANPINRYLINSPMLPQLRRDPDGGLTLVIRHDPPGRDWETNWLPAPKGAFIMALRLYWPKEEAINGTWTAPELVKDDPVKAAKNK